MLKSTPEQARERAEERVKMANGEPTLCWGCWKNRTTKRYHRVRNGQGSTLPERGIPICDSPCKPALEAKGWTLEEVEPKQEVWGNSADMTDS